MESFAFGRFKLLPDRRLVLADEKPVAISARAFDILEFLVRHHDRVVTRDELVAHVWRGVTVGENNLSVQICNLRRALDDQKGQGLIVNVPGQGYRFVGDIDDRPPGPVDRVADRSSPAFARRRLVVLGLASLLALPIITTELWPIVAKFPGRQDLRLTTEIAHFESIDGSGASQALAKLYETEIATHFRRYEDLVITPAGSGQSQTHFRIMGSVAISGADTIATLRLLQAPDWREIDAETATTPTGLPFPEHQSLAIVLAGRFRAAIFAGEKVLRHHTPRDALDLLIDAHVAVRDLDNVDDLDRAIALLNQPAAHPSNAAKAFLSFLSTQRLLRTPARQGQNLAKQAETLIEDVLRIDPLNVVFLSYRALMLASQNRLSQAQETIARALERAPTYGYLSQLYGEILLQRGDLDLAARYILGDKDLPSDDRLPTLRLAQGDTAEALVLFERVLDGATPTLATGFTLLLKAAAEYRLGRKADATDSLARAKLILGSQFSRVADQRQSNYMLPDEAWTKFCQDLTAIGMTP